MSVSLIRSVVIKKEDREYKKSFSVLFLSVGIVSGKLKALLKSTPLCPFFCLPFLIYFNFRLSFKYFLSRGYIKKQLYKALFIGNKATRVK